MAGNGQCSAFSDLEPEMPLPNRLNLPGVPQHVTQRGNNRQACFFEDADYRLYLSLLAAACQRHRCTVHAYVLMTSHVLSLPESESVPRFLLGAQSRLNK